MGEWDFLGKLLDVLQTHSTMLGRFWLLLMLIFRILVLGTIASDLFEDEQEEFACNTLQPGCKQVCYDMAFPISQYRFWVLHIVLLATPSMVFLVYAMHHHNKRPREVAAFRILYLVNVIFRLLAEIGFLVGQWGLYGFTVEAQFPCSRFPCPYTVDCFTSRPAEKTIFLRFYFVVGGIAAISSFVEFFYGFLKWFCCPPSPPRNLYASQNLENIKQEEKPQTRTASESTVSAVRSKGGSLRSSRKVSSFGYKHRGGRYVSTRPFMV